MLGIFMGWRFFDLFKQDGLWKKEALDPELDLNRIYPAEKIDGLNAEQKEVKK
jgi:hypothetical protein